MSESFSGQLSVNVTAALRTTLDIGTGIHNVSQTYTNNFANGTGADQANQMWTDTRTLTASSTENLDMSGALTNTFGTTVAFTSVKAIVIKAAAANTNDVVVGGAASNAFSAMFGDATDKLVLKPGCVFSLLNPNANGYAVTAATADILKIANSSSGTSVTYDIIIIGEV